MERYSLQVTKQWIRYAIKGTGWTMQDLSKAAGYSAPHAISHMLRRTRNPSIAVISKILKPMEIEFSDFYACLEGKPGDLRIHIGKWLLLGPGPKLNSLGRFPQSNHCKGVRTPKVGVFDLDDARRDMPHNTVVNQAGWYILNSTSDQEKAEAWSILGLINSEIGRCRHSAYAFRESLKLIPSKDTSEYATLMERLSQLSQAAGDPDLADKLLAQSMDLHVIRGTSSRLVRSVMDEFSNLYSRELRRFSDDPTSERLAMLSGLVKSQVNALRQAPIPR